MTTKEKILTQALALFNERGTDAVTVRDIAQALNMSHGNLCYHFPNTDALVEALYHQLVGELDALVLRGVEAAQSGITLALTIDMTRASFATLYGYRFLMLDFVRIMRRVPTMKAHYRALTAQRRQQFTHIIHALAAGGWVAPPQYDAQFDHWIEQATLVGDFWIASSEILFEGAESEKVEHYVQLFLAGIRPFLTEKGQADLLKYR